MQILPPGIAMQKRISTEKDSPRAAAAVLTQQHPKRRNVGLGSKLSLPGTNGMTSSIWYSRYRLASAAQFNLTAGTYSNSRRERSDRTRSFYGESLQRATWHPPGTRNWIRERAGRKA